MPILCSGFLYSGIPAFPRSWAVSVQATINDFSNFGKWKGIFISFDLCSKNWNNHACETALCKTLLPWRFHNSFPTWGCWTYMILCWTPGNPLMHRKLPRIDRCQCHGGALFRSTQAPVLITRIPKKDHRDRQRTARCWAIFHSSSYGWWKSSFKVSWASRFSDGVLDWLAEVNLKAKISAFI